MTIAHLYGKVNITCFLAYFIDLFLPFWYNRRNMSQELLIKMVSVGDKNGVGKGHTYYTRFNNKNKKNPSQKYEAKKFNPISQTHCVYKQKK
jgi:ribosomal protein L33